MYKLVITEKENTKQNTAIVYRFFYGARDYVNLV